MDCGSCSGCGQFCDFPNCLPPIKRRQYDERQKEKQSEEVPQEAVRMTSTTPSPITDQAAGEPQCTCAVRLMPGQIGATHSQDCAITAWGRAAFKASGENAQASPAASALTDEQRDIATFKWHAKQEDAGLTVSGRDRLIFMDGFNAAKALLAASTDMKPAGIASAMPGVAEWTVTVCKAEDVPIGTQLYVR